MKRADVGPGQESVWDYPRPPRAEPASAVVSITFADVEIALSRRAWRVLETSHPPVYYLPPEDVRLDLLEPASGGSMCEWKGDAVYWSVRVGGRVATRAAWSYPNPTPAFASVRDYLAFYPGRVDACTIDGERVRAQPGDFYGGWITDSVVGPFKGDPGTRHW